MRFQLHELGRLDPHSLEPEFSENPLPRGCKWRVFADWLLALSG